MRWQCRYAKPYAILIVCLVKKVFRKVIKLTAADSALKMVSMVENTLKKQKRAFDRGTLVIRTVYGRVIQLDTMHYMIGSKGTEKNQQDVSIARKRVIYIGRIRLADIFENYLTGYHFVLNAIRSMTEIGLKEKETNMVNLYKPI